MKLGVFIPGRLSSERLPQKLILPLGESCLWEIACKKLNELPEKYNKYVLCYDQELIDIAKKYSNIKIIIRDKKTANAEGPLKYIFKDLKNVEDTHLMFLNPCLSFLSKDTIIEALEKFEKSYCDYGTSVKPIQNWLFTDTGENLNDINYERLTTKEIGPIWEAAHCFHIFDKKKFFKDGLMLKKGHLLISVPKKETIDVDTPEDYEYAKYRHKKKYVIDIDGTICDLPKGCIDYSKAEPIKEKIERFNNLYDGGNTIVYFTARGYETGIDWRDVTEQQFKKWGVKYHNLIFGKPSADIYIGDKMYNVTDIV